MNQKERIMQLVQQGVITTEDALILLENNQKSTETKDLNTTNLEKMQEVEYHLTAAHSEMDMLESLELIAPLNAQQKQRVQELESEIQALQNERDNIEHAEVHEEEVEENNEEVHSSSFNSTTNEFVQQMGSLLKKTGNHVQNYLKEAVERQKELRTPKPFEKNYEFTAQEFSQMNIDIHTGNIQVKVWQQSHVKVEVKANLYTLEDDLEELFLKNSQLQVNADELLIRIADKNIAVDLVVYLPENDYHHIAIHTETGNITLDAVHFEDGYVKTTHGSLTLNALEGVMLESYTTNGHIQLNHCHIREVVADAVNGKINATGEYTMTQMVTTNGDIVICNQARDIQEMTQETLNGNIDITVQQGLPFAINANTKYGMIHHQLAHLEVIVDETTRSGQILTGNVRYNSSLIPAFILRAHSKTGTITLHQDGGKATC